VIEIEDLRVDYGTQRAVDGLWLRVEEGSMFGLLGPNGAGKSSTIRCIATVQQPTSGTIRVGGHDASKEPEAVRRLLGVVPQGLAIYEALSVRQNLRILGGLQGLSGASLTRRVDWGLELSQLGDHRDKAVGTLSGGMKRRLNLAASLLHDPKVLIFDEPTTGVDPQSRNHIFDTIRALHRDGRTVVYTTHYMEEVEALCDRVAVVDRGRLVACDTLPALLGRAAPSALRVHLLDGEDPVELAARLTASGLGTDRIEPLGQSLENVFLSLTGHALRDTP
jgi:ABC-2 type transport system ATP-binding protein